MPSAAMRGHLDSRNCVFAFGSLTPIILPSCGVTTFERYRPSTRASASPPQPPSQPPPPAPGPPPRPQYSLRTRLREETSAPFRKVRQFVYLGSAASAAVGGFISALRVVAGLSGVRGTQPLSETFVNVGVDAAAVAFFAYLWTREQQAGTQRLERMRRGAKIAALLVEEPVTGKVVKLAHFRGHGRVVIVAAPTARLVACMAEAESVKAELAECQILVVPLEIKGESESVGGYRAVARGSWVARPLNDADWQDWLASERELSSRSSLSDDDVFVVVLRNTGKVGSRTIGSPDWSKLAADAGASKL
jgi:hypothetical protein